MKSRKIFCVVAYDIADDRRRNRLIKVIEKYGTRINYSVYECMFTQNQLLKVQNRISKIISMTEDQVVYYPICLECYSKIIYQPDRKSVGKAIVIC